MSGGAGEACRYVEDGRLGAGVSGSMLAYGIERPPIAVRAGAGEARQTMAKFETVDQYVASFPAPVQLVLEELRQTIRRAIPGSDESIRYDMPCVKLDGTYVVHFAAWKQHIGMYPIPGFSDELEAEIAPLRAAKDTVRLVYRQPVPQELIERLLVRLMELRSPGEG